MACLVMPDAQHTHTPCQTVPHVAITIIAEAPSDTTPSFLPPVLPRLVHLVGHPQAADAAPTGVTWDAASSTLTVTTPGGNPRVFTSTRFVPSFSTDSTPTQIKETAKPVYEQDNVRINWGRAPEVLEVRKSSGAGAAARPWLLGAAAAAAAALLAAVW